MPHALFCSLCTVVIAAVITVRYALRADSVPRVKEGKAAHGPTAASSECQRPSASRLLPFGPLLPLLRPSLRPSSSLRPSTLDPRASRTRSRNKILDVLLPERQLTCLQALGSPGAPFLSAFAYLRPGRPSFCQGPHKTSNFDFRGARPLLQIYKYLYACIKFRGRLPFSAVCESSATKPLVCDVFFKPT